MTIRMRSLRFQSTPPARGATGAQHLPGDPRHISIHAPREGGDMGVVCRVVGGVIFQSTPPARGATPAKHAGIRARRNFNPRPPARGATLMVSVDTPTAYISIHAPREGGRPDSMFSPVYCTFISIHAPREGGDVINPAPIPAIRISIHAPREGGDSQLFRMGKGQRDFNPRPPRGGRPPNR